MEVLPDAWEGVGHVDAAARVGDAGVLAVGAGAGDAALEDAFAAADVQGEPVAGRHRNRRFRRENCSFRLRGLPLSMHDVGVDAEADIEEDTTQAPEALVLLAPSPAPAESHNIIR